LKWSTNVSFHIIPNLKILMSFDATQLMQLKQGC
jgi:hypothetical protein